MLLLRVTSMSKGINFTPFLPLKVLYNPKAFFIHAAWLHQACAHCAIFPTAASRRSLDRVSVPVWLVILRPARDRRLGEPLPHLLANPIWAHPMARGPKVPSLVLRRYAVLATVSVVIPSIRQFPDITHPSATRQQRSKLLPVTVRLACVRPAASVQSEP